MDTEIHNPVQTPRSQRSSLSALLVVSLLIGVTISAIKPGVRALHRDASAELLATRHIAQSLVRVVRGLAATGVRTPEVRTAPNRPAHHFPVRMMAGAETLLREAGLLRESLLALPPPVA